MSATHTATEHSQPVVFPPVIPLAAFVLGVVLDQLVPVARSISGPTHAVVRGVGVLVLVAGALGFGWMVRTMKKARTPIHNAKTPTALVESGPFAFTRNPMYLFGSIAYAGLALVLFQPWSLALLPFVVALTHVGVVLREEEFLARRFGDAYSDYKKRVPRWL